MESVIAQVEDFKVIERGEEFRRERTGERISGEIKVSEVSEIREVLEDDAFESSGRKQKTGHSVVAINGDLATDSVPLTAIGTRPVQRRRRRRTDVIMEGQERISVEFAAGLKKSGHQRKDKDQ